MPQNNGSTIMLPMDWVQISGSDFDVDKLYMMLKDISENLEGNPFEQQYNFNNKEYSFDQLIGELRNMTTSQRNNIMIDMIYEMLTSEYSVPKFTRAGNFKSLERQAEIFDIEENTDYDTLVSELSNGKYFYEDDGKQKKLRNVGGENECASASYSQLLGPVTFSVSLGKSLPHFPPRWKEKLGSLQRMCTGELECWEQCCQFVPCLLCPHQPRGLWDIAPFAPEGSVGFVPHQR